ncbi:MAG TPA: O-methyltransferase [Nitrospiria bacterium]|nr:O-methyltransferase [Nitrospiria bacterium]
MDIVDARVEAYLEELIPQRDPTLEEMEHLGRRLRFPIVGPLVGRLLCQVATLSGARRVFEMGSGFGYSAYWFSKGMSKEGEIFCTDGDRERLQRAEEFFKQGQPARRVRFLEGDAIELIDQIEGTFDIIFIDIDKARYPQAFHKAMPRLKSGGLLIADNVLWFGSVITPSEDPDTLGIQGYNRLVFESPELFSTLLPLRDGVSISLKS